MTPGKRGRIVVGIDGSPSSRDAIRWAANEAELRHANLGTAHIAPRFLD
jgi:nucleotide-binding universal stress UspA family protein